MKYCLMENKESQILSEIMDMMASIRSQLELLDAKMAELQNTVGQEDAEVVPIDLDIDDVPEVEVVPEVVETVEVDDLPFYDEPEEETADEPVAEEPVSEPVSEPVDEPVDEPSAEPAVEPMEEQEEETVADEPVAEDPVVEDDDDDLPIFAEPEPVYESAPVGPKVKKAVIDAMTDKQAWRTDMPGTAVKDIRSAISLNDRILFINALFGQDPMAFQDALTRINQMSSLDEAVDFVVSEKPHWDLESETVYRFMMAVRRKLR